MCAFVCVHLKWSVFTFPVPCRCVSLISGQNQNLCGGTNLKFSAWTMCIFAWNTFYYVNWMLLAVWLKIICTTKSLALIAIDSSYYFTRTRAHINARRKDVSPISPSVNGTLFLWKFFDHICSRIQYWRVIYVDVLVKESILRRKETNKNSISSFLLSTLTFQISLRIFDSNVCFWNTHAS